MLEQGQESKSTEVVSEGIDVWKKIAAVLHKELPHIDQALTQADIPVSARPQLAFDVVSDTMLDVSDPSAFLLSAARGAFHVIIGDWYRDRYGDAVDDQKNRTFAAALLIRGTPFALEVPMRFTMPGDEPNTVWFGWPASVQAEEDPLRWIQSKGVVDGLSSKELVAVGNAARKTSNLVRSTGFDLRSLKQDPDSAIGDLAGAALSDIQSSARNLCGQNEATWRSAAWDCSQATEKTLKLLIRRKGGTPPHSHDLSGLADQAESLRSERFDRAMLALVPSGRVATTIRYGGEMSLSKASKGYAAALGIIQQAAFDAKPDTRLNYREARLLLQRPPWFDFDTQGFSAKLRD